jgi:hypothetical protein
LEQPLAEDSVVDDRLVDEPGETRSTVDLSLPLGGAGRAEEDKVLETEERLGFAVALLLLAEGLEREAAIVPDNGRGAECDDSPLLLEAPAEIDIVARLAVFGIESANLVKGPAMEGHIASGDVLRHDIG